LTWNKVSDHEVQFKLTASPVPRWFAVGFSHSKGKNLMTGPPASESVRFELQEDGTGKLAHVSLDRMPPSDTVGTPLASNSSVVIVSGGKVSVSFTIDTKLGNYEIPGPDGQTHTFIYAYGESSGDLGMAYHTAGRRGSVDGIDFNVVKDSNVPSPAAATVLSPAVARVPSPVAQKAMGPSPNDEESSFDFELNDGSRSTPVAGLIAFSAVVSSLVFMYR
jgi:hypothetical protein